MKQAIHKLFITWLYKKIVNEIYIPSPVGVVVYHYPSISKKKGVQSIRIVRKRPNYYRYNEEHYIFNDFGNVIDEI